MRRKKSNLGITLLLLVVLGVVGGVVYLANSPMFERNKPVIEAPASLYWNLRKPIVVILRDDTGIRSYKVVLSDGKNSFEVANVTLESPKKEVRVEVKLPRAGWDRRTAAATMRIEVRDTSNWNMFKGNEATKETHISIDAIRPRVNVLANSYKITQGGSALVVFGASDANLKEVGIHTSFGKVFKAEPFYKEGYYAALIAWPVTVKRFRAWVEAKDLADNVTKAHVPLYVERYRYRRSNITLKNRFLDGKIFSRDNARRSPQIHDYIRGGKDSSVPCVLKPTDVDVKVLGDSACCCSRGIGSPIEFRPLQWLPVLRWRGEIEPGRVYRSVPPVYFFVFQSDVAFRSGFQEYFHNPGFHQ